MPLFVFCESAAHCLAILVWLPVPHSWQQEIGNISSVDQWKAFPNTILFVSLANGTPDNWHTFFCTGVSKISFSCLIKSWKSSNSLSRNRERPLRSPFNMWGPSWSASLLIYLPTNQGNQYLVILPDISISHGWTKIAAPSSSATCRKTKPAVHIISYLVFKFLPASPI